jgi:hypothetical protein
VKQSEKQEFIGGLITSIIVQEGAKVVGKAVQKGLKKVADRTDNTVTEADVKKAAPVVTKQVEAELIDETQARAEHKLDAEPHWQSRNIWGAFVAAVGAVDVMWRLWTDDQLNTPSDYLGPLGIVLGILTPLYSRFIAKKPLFR